MFFIDRSRYGKAQIVWQSYIHFATSKMFFWADPMFWKQILKEEKCSSTWYQSKISAVNFAIFDWWEIAQTKCKKSQIHKKYIFIQAKKITTKKFYNFLPFLIINVLFWSLIWNGGLRDVRYESPKNTAWERQNYDDLHTPKTINGSIKKNCVSYNNLPRAILWIVFRIVSTMAPHGSYLLKSSLKFLVVCQFTSGECNSRYIGETFHHLSTGTKEHTSADK